MTKINKKKLIEKDIGNNIISLRDIFNFNKEKKKNKFIRETIFLDNLKK